MLLLVPFHRQMIPQWRRWWCHLRRLSGWALRLSSAQFEKLFGDLAKVSLGWVPLLLEHYLTWQSDRRFWRTTNGVIFNPAERCMSYSDNRWVRPPAKDKRLPLDSPLRQTGRQTLKSAAAMKPFFSSPDYSKAAVHRWYNDGHKILSEKSKQMAKQEPK